MKFIAIKFMTMDKPGGHFPQLNWLVVPEENVEEMVTALKKEGSFGIESSSPFEMNKAWR